MPKFRKKPVVIEAIITRLVIAETKVAWHLLPQWIKDAYEAGKLVICSDAIYIATLEGSMRAEPSDWIIQGVKGELYPCKPDIFEQTYEQCSELETPAAQPKFKGDMLEHLKALMKTQETPAALVSVPCALCGMQAISDAPCHGNCGRLGCPGIHLIEPA